MSLKESLTYRGAGVNYAELDPFKVEAQHQARQTIGEAALETAMELARLKLRVDEESWGESAFLIETEQAYLAHVEEGLGTKNLVTEAMYRLTGTSRYADVSQDTIAMIFNDLATSGASPISSAMHLAVGHSDWFKDEGRWKDILRGWKQACIKGRCPWGGGETPALKGVVIPETFVFSGSAMGIIQPKERRIHANAIEEGDSIMLLDSSGIHANGLSLARKIADALPDGYLTKMSDGRAFGDGLLDPTVLYGPIVQDLLEAGIPLHYAVNVTGHGFRKLMRANRPFAYVLDKIPEPQPVFRFMQEHGPVDEKEAYSNLNMGAGFALYVPPNAIDAVETCAAKHGIRALNAGHIEKSNERSVSIKPVGLTFAESDMKIR